MKFTEAAHGEVTLSLFLEAGGYNTHNTNVIQTESKNDITSYWRERALLVEEKNKDL
ncbi:hypothetical protein [Paenibacillus sp. FSL H7-0331]|uniref:hypothetical protein n=1 Tax=Paenibacillus sp. FSL H7-0331 TaxID=1920421 RepID=UPI0015C2CD08|nr:hypothetical protein [Paenibacillus sp. FSL H7-0331]